jgi:signal transduction histidine kinase
MEELSRWTDNALFDAMPMGIAVIDRDFNIVSANKAFERMFGEWRHRKCFAVYKSRQTICQECRGSEAFADGIPRVNQEEGYNRHGRLTRYVKHTIPVRDKSGEVSFLLEISTDVTESELLKREYQLLFDEVPCNISILDSNLKIIKTNKRMRENFGPLEGQFCYESLKGRNHECGQCPARLTFGDGQMHTAPSQVLDIKGRKVDFQVTTVPLGVTADSFDYVMEMAVDVTETLRLQEELKVAYTFMEAMVAASIDGIVTLNETFEVTVANPAARRILEAPTGHRITREQMAAVLPEGFFARVSTASGPVYEPDTLIKTFGGKTLPARIVGMRLMLEGKPLGMAFSFQDLTEMKTLEKEKLVAERLAAVGQTVAGLAHGIKNLITGLEGGMYMLKSGVEKGAADRMVTGMDMLERNLVRIALFVRQFLSFSKGREIKVASIDPARVADEVVELYAARAKEHNITLVHEKREPVGRADLDFEGMHEALTNLVGNAIDACRMSENPANRVVVRTMDLDDAIIYEVEDDGVGMDYEVKQKVFTNFFTTKGTGGTGLGLLTTKKIIQEHGGRITMASEPGKGSVFRVILPRNRMPKPVADQQGQKA